ncbi:MAG: hypothetical protein FJ138_07050, partial [Deltaproteobacteria bacterium]|nr:hypothetical protein [Deltaproteobacteria bacterium]
MTNPRDLLHQRIKNRFVPTELISRSDVAATFKGSDERGQQPVIIKYYLPTPSTPQLHEEAMRAVRFQAQQRSPRILSVLDFDSHPTGGVWQAMELHAGPNLLRYTRAKGRLSAPQAAALLGGLCDALEPLHAEGRFHGNLKPTNVFLNEQGSPRSVRLGDATGSGLSGVHKLGEARVTFNDPTFFTHEQASGKDLAPTADIGALGLIAYFVLTGRFPFEGRGADKILAEVLIKSGRLEVKPEEVEGAAAEVEALLRLTHACLAKSPAKRPATLSQVRDALLEVGVSAEQGQRASIALAPVNTIAPGDPLTALGRLGPQTSSYEAISLPEDESPRVALETTRREYQASVLGARGATQGMPTALGLAAVSAPPAPPQTLISASRPAASMTLMSAAPPLEVAEAPTTPAPRFTWGEGDDDMRSALSALAAEMGLGELGGLEGLGALGQGQGQGQALDARAEEHDAPPTRELEVDLEAELRSLAEVSASGEWGDEAGQEAGDAWGHEAGDTWGHEAGDTWSHEAGGELLAAELTPPEEMLFMAIGDDEPAASPAAPVHPSPPSAAADDARSPSRSPSLSPSLNINPPSLSQTLGSSTHLEPFGEAGAFPNLPGWQSLMSLRGDSAALAQALARAPLPLTGHLLPFSQFQMQLEGAQLNETFFTEVPKLTLPPLPQAAAAAGGGASAAPSPLEGAGRVEGAAPPPRALPGWAAALALALTLAGGAYAAGVDLEA